MSSPVPCVVSSSEVEGVCGAGATVGASETTLRPPLNKFNAGKKGKRRADIPRRAWLSPEDDTFVSPDDTTCARRVAVCKSALHLWDQVSNLDSVHSELI